MKLRPTTWLTRKNGRLLSVEHALRGAFLRFCNDGLIATLIFFIADKWAHGDTVQYAPNFNDNCVNVSENEKSKMRWISSIYCLVWTEIIIDAVTLWIEWEIS